MDPNLSPREPYYLLKAFEHYVHQLNNELNRNTVIILDEAQGLNAETLTELKNLTNLNSDFNSPLTVILFGQPELRELVASLPPIDQRVSLRFHLNALSEIDVKGYIETRLRVCGHPTGELFDELSVKGIARITHGIPREINRACKLSLELAAAQRLQKVNIDIVKAVHMDLQRQRGGQ
jgi:general secretion pathway protein A